MSRAPLVIEHARLVDPESGYDGPGAILIVGDEIADVVHQAQAPGAPTEARTIDADGNMVCPGLVDLRVKTGEPGAEPKETLKSALRAAAAGGVTTLVVMPDTDPPVDDPAVVDFILRRARDIGLGRVIPAGAATKGLQGKALAEIGLMHDAGCAFVCDADRPIVDSRVMRRVMAYAGGLGVMVAHRPSDPWLSDGAAAHESEFAGRLGLAGAPAAAETIMLERDLALLDLVKDSGARLLADQISAEASLPSLARAKDRNLPLLATVSINHLTFNEFDIGDYRTFWKLTPPLRGESDRAALVEALATGLIDIIVSAHAPAPAEDKRLPFQEATPGSIGLETLLSALLTLYHEGHAPLTRLIGAASLAPARALGKPFGRLARGAPADLIVVDLDAPRIIDAQALASKSKNSAFDGRRLQGQVLTTLAEGEIIYESECRG